MATVLEQMQERFEKVGEAFELYKSENDKRIEKIEKGESTAANDERLKTLDDAMDGMRDTIKNLEEELKKQKRPENSNKSIDAEKYEKAFNSFLRKGIEEGLSELQTKAVQVVEDSDGGFAVPETLDNQIVQYEKDGTPMREICTVRTMSDENYRKLINVGGTASGWVGETDERPETDTPKLDQIRPHFGEIYANPAATQRSLDDVNFDVAGWLATEVSDEFNEQENKAFTIGDSIKKPKGLLTYDTTESADVSQKIQFRLSKASGKLGSNSSGIIDNLIDLTIDLRAAYRTQARWMFSRNVLRDIRKLKDSDNNLIWQPSLEAGQPSRILQYPFTENEDMPDVENNNFPIAFGNFKRAFHIIDIKGIRVLRDPFTKKPYILFYTTKRMGSMLNNSQAVKFLKVGTASAAARA